MADNPQSAEEQKRLVHRSPNFPGLSLQDALAKVQTIYAHDKRAPTSASVILEHLGFGKSLSGSAGRVLSAMRQYGLLEEVGEQWRVSEGAFLILTLSEHAPERREAIRQAAVKPAIFREVLAEYKDGLPSDATFRDWLITRKQFNPASVEGFIRSFKSTAEYAKLWSGYTADGGTPEKPPAVQESQSMNTQTTNAGGNADSGQPPQAIPAMSWVLSVPRGVRAELKIIGSDVKVSDLLRLKAQIDFLVQSFTDDEAEGQN